MQPTRCKTDVPELRKLADGHLAACHWAEDIKAGRIKPQEVEPVVQEPMLAPPPEPACLAKRIRQSGNPRSRGHLF